MPKNEVFVDADGATLWHMVGARALANGNYVPHFEIWKTPANGGHYEQEFIGDAGDADSHDRMDEAFRIAEASAKSWLRINSPS